MARKYINLFDENGNPVRVPLGADAENVDIESVNGLEAENVQEAIEELAGQQTTIEMDDAPTENSQKAVKSGGVASALVTKQDKLTGANAGNGISISEQGVISATGGGGGVNIRGTIEQLAVTWQVGYIIADGTAVLSAQSSWKVTDLFTVTNKAGKYLFIPGYFDKKSAYEDWYMYSKYNSNSTLEKVQQFNMWGRSYLIIPITSDSESYRICMKKTYTNYGAVYLVDRDWLVSAGYADEWTGKTWFMYGDSYVQGQDIAPTWHDFFAMWHHTSLIRDGYKGMGLMLNANGNMFGTLVTHLESDLKPNGELIDVDIIGVCLGRNDYSKGVPIGNIDDIVTAYSTTNPTSLSHYTCYDREAKSTDTEQDHPNVIQATFCGGLNYLCKWLLTEYPDKRIFFLTPWYFLDDNPAGQATTAPVEYVDAVKAVAGKWGIPCFDAARQGGISVQSQAFRDLYFRKESGQEHSNDTSHLSIAGHRRMATGPVAGWLENLFRD